MNQKKRELEQNELADAADSILDKLRPHLPKIAMFSAVAVLGIIAIAFWMKSRRSVVESQWREYLVSSRFADPRGYDTVADFFPDTPVGNLALINGADANFAEGALSMLDREKYSTSLKQAVEKYEKVLDSRSIDEFAKRRATYALGYAYEAMGRFDKAREMYEAVISSSKDTPEAELAEKSLQRVNDPMLTSIHSAFSEWSFDSNEEAPGPFGGGAVLPSRPNIGMPQAMEQPAEMNPESDG